MKHTDTPWHIQDNGAYVICHKEGNIASMHAPRIVSDEKLDGESWLDMRERTAQDRWAVIDEINGNAEFIVKAVNSHDALVAALRDVLSGRNRGTSGRLIIDSMQEEFLADLLAKST